uniref:Integral membrane protein 2 n=1 Tax=Panagrolaimus sp. PS1159 TaxID=55785 RepID=A0AC35GP54_9BILA
MDSSTSSKKDEMPTSSPPVSPSKLTIDEKSSSLPTSPIPFSPSPPPLRVSPPPSYASNNGSFRRCDNKQPSACIYCGNAGGKNNNSPKYWGESSKAQAQYFLERSQQALRAMTFLGLALFFIVIFILLVYGNQHFFQPKTFSGWCGTSFVDDGQPRHFAQEMEINPNELYEKIQVPKFGLNRPAVFVHDFRKNITAIVDVLG